MASLQDIGKTGTMSKNDIESFEYIELLRMSNVSQSLCISMIPGPQGQCAFAADWCPDNPNAPPFLFIGDDQLIVEITKDESNIRGFVNMTLTRRRLKLPATSSKTDLSPLANLHDSRDR